MGETPQHHATPPCIVWSDATWLHGCWTTPSVSLPRLFVLREVSWCFEPSRLTEDYIRADSKLQSISSLLIPQVIVYHKSLFLKPNIISTTSKSKPRKTITCLGTYLYSTGTRHGNLHQLSVTMSAVTKSILRFHTRASVSHSQHRKSLGEV